MRDPSGRSAKEKQLRGSTAWQKKPYEAAPIGVMIEQFLSKRNPQLNRAEKVVQAWESAVPQALRRRCRLAGFLSGVLTVEAPPGPFLHQLQMIRSQMLQEIKTRCPLCGLREIRILPGRAVREEAEQ